MQFKKIAFLIISVTLLFTGCGSKDDEKEIIKELNDDFVKQLEQVISQHKGSKHVKFKIRDHQDKIELQMPSKTKKVEISKELLLSLQDFNLSYKLN